MDATNDLKEYIDKMNKFKNENLYIELDFLEDENKVLYQVSLTINGITSGSSGSMWMDTLDVEQVKKQIDSSIINTSEYIARQYAKILINEISFERKFTNL